MHPARHAALGAGGFQPLLQAGPGGLELAIGGAAVGLELLQGGEAGGHRQRVAGQRSGLVDGAGRCHPLHQLAAAAVGADRQPAADHLAEGGQVGLDPEQLLGAAEGDAEAGHHLVENEQRAVAVAQLAETFEVPLDRRHQTHVAGDRLDEDAGHLVAVAAEQVLDRQQVVVRGGERVGGHRARHAGRRRHAEGRGAGAGGDQKGVAVAVVAALELDELVAAGGGAGEAQGGHRGLGAGVDQAHHLDVRQRRR